jgi:hypothetical protein
MSLSIFASMSSSDSVDFAGRRDQRRLRELLGRLADIRPQDDRQTRLAVEVFSEPRPVAERAYDGAKRCAIPAGFRNAPVVWLRAQLQRLNVRARERLHVRTRE